MQQVAGRGTGGGWVERPGLEMPQLYSFLKLGCLAQGPMQGGGIWAARGESLSCLCCFWGKRGQKKVVSGWILVLERLGSSEREDEEARET